MNATELQQQARIGAKILGNIAAAQLHDAKTYVQWAVKDGVQENYQHAETSRRLAHQTAYAARMLGRISRGLPVTNL